MDGTVVATILPFAKLNAVVNRSAPGARASASGEIVIFPGVRVEYHHDHPPSPKGRPTGKGGRSAAKGAVSA